MQRVLAIFEMTVKKVKEPAFVLLFCIAALIGACVSEMDSLSFNQNSDMLYGLVSIENGHTLLSGFCIILFMTSIVAIFSGATDIPKDIRSRMIMLILTKPVTRIEYLIGKYLGVVVICVMFFFSAAITAAIVHFFRAGEIYSVSTIIRQLFLLLAVLPFAAMTMMISAYLSDVSAMIIAAIYLIFSVFISAMSVVVDMLPQSLGVGTIIHLISYFFPNFFFFFNSFNFAGIFIIALVLYSVSLSVIFLMITATRLTSRDMI